MYVLTTIFVCFRSKNKKKKIIKKTTKNIKSFLTKVLLYTTVHIFDKQNLFIADANKINDNTKSIIGP